MKAISVGDTLRRPDQGDKQVRQDDGSRLYGEVYRLEDDQIAELAAVSGPWVFWGITSALSLGLLALL